MCVQTPKCQRRLLPLLDTWLKGGIRVLSDLGGLAVGLSPCGISVLSHRARGRQWCPAPELPRCGTSDRQRRCVAGSSAGAGPWGPQPRRGPRPPPGPSCAWFSGPGPLRWLRSAPSPDRCGWGSPCARLCYRTSSGAFPRPPRSTSVDPEETGQGLNCAEVQGLFYHSSQHSE